jgi:GrpB-like predicted nucleotidyltransferase (UPF0157 family)
VSELGLRWDQVRLAEWTPLWADEFDAEAGRILRDWPDATIEHVGSTAVANLPSKPIIDILVGVGSDRRIETVERLKALGYQPHTEKDRGDRIFLWLGEGDVSRFHINVTHVGSETWRSLLRFRDVLRSDTCLRERCATEKRALADRHGNDRMAYLDAKSRLVAELLGSPERA